ncbi:hypothetical protein B0T19DRAFT_425840 [Cercophora scortea]|uniref:Uncharacterized protein n=1 Tax=Cercophora scortea TaxID=314031 RepID=A0AAE0IDX5_9PEZI|nr:hypothetical protein B0T19DRAFT_425840 [Cercophora scortea]
MTAMECVQCLGTSTTKAAALLFASLPWPWPWPLSLLPSRLGGGGGGGLLLLLLLLRW